MNNTQRVESPSLVRPRPSSKGPHVDLSAIAPSAGAKSMNATSTAWQLESKGVCKRYRKGQTEIPVLRGVDLQVRRGEFLAIIGQSGSGKSTLLHILGTLDAPDEGRV